MPQPQNTKVRHFLSLNDLTSSEFKNLIEHAIELKKEPYKKNKKVKNKHLALIFETASTRTRVSFETGFNQLGGHVINLHSDQSQIGRGEPITDTAKVISSMVDIVAARILSHDNIIQLAKHSKVPVINALSNRFHPCQILADVMTFTEIRGSIKGARVAWIGDGNNVCQSWMNAARILDFKLAIATPENHRPDQDIIELNQSHIEIHSNDREPNEMVNAAITGADVVVTDTWVSMGDEAQKEARKKVFAPYRITNELMKKADKDVMFMHCLPAYRGLEMDADVIDGPMSVVWQEAENRLHSQKALLLFLLS